MEKVLDIKAINKKYGKQHALKDISLQINKGDIYGIIGRNGAGKTTLLKSIVKMIGVDSGEIQLFGSVSKKEYLKQLKRVGNIIETPVAYDQLTAKENLTYYCKLNGIVEKNAVAQALEFVDLKDTGKKRYKNFSLGMKQKLGLAIALLNKPDFLILDEPINGLDPIAIVEFRELLLKLNQENITILISSHVLDELYHVATRFGFIKDGILVEEITKETFIEKNQAFIHLEVKNTKQATRVLETMAIKDFKIVSQTQINIYQTEMPIHILSRELIMNDVAINSIYQENESLENYFKDLITI
ncbi:ABC transporter ATP-binding protein [Amphibacillus sp. Q70]|uniref:ABC transporter ATP-binding protein n=1 Tax=Amphibacillus sp. Q70 TaxID=3453416 RepID=UPI003F85D57D